MRSVLETGQSIALEHEQFQAARASGLEHVPIILTHLTGFSRLLARQASRCGLTRPQVKHNAARRA